jgi:hypothetical protein
LQATRRPALPSFPDSVKLATDKRSLCGRAVRKRLGALRKVAVAIQHQKACLSEMDIARQVRHVRTEA